MNKSEVEFVDSLTHSNVEDKTYSLVLILLEVFLLIMAYNEMIPDT
jgi:hypothetical protein